MNLRASESIECGDDASSSANFLVPMLGPYLSAAGISAAAVNSCFKSAPIQTNVTSFTRQRSCASVQAENGIRACIGNLLLETAGAASKSFGFVKDSIEKIEALDKTLSK